TTAPLKPLAKNGSTSIFPTTKCVKNKLFGTILDILNQGWGWMLLRGTAMTLLISVFGMALGIAIGIAGATIKVSGPRLLSFLVSCYTTVVRSIPELLIIYLLFFGTIQSISDLA